MRRLRETGRFSTEMQAAYVLPPNTSPETKLNPALQTANSAFLQKTAEESTKKLNHLKDSFKRTK